MRWPALLPFFVTTWRTRVTMPPTTAVASWAMVATSAEFPVQNVASSPLNWSSGCPLTWKPRASFSNASACSRGHGSVLRSACAGAAPAADFGATLSKSPKNVICPTRRSSLRLWPVFTASSMVATSAARSSTACSESNAPPFTSASMVARFTARRSTRSQKSKMSLKRPPLVRSAMIAWIAASPLPLMAFRPKRTCPCTASRGSPSR
jgi:hypothetical protein